MSQISLPIDPLVSEISQIIKRERNVILTATPGAGKTTRLPPTLLNCVPRKIAVLQPRRLAAISACQRIAEENGWTVGRDVGYQVRFDSKVSSETRLVFMTDALMVRRLIEDPELSEFDLIVIDEFHERNLNQDILLGCIRELQDLDSTIKLLVMSATLDVNALLRFLPGAQHIDVPGKVYPLEIRYSQKPLILKTDYDFYDRVTKAIQLAEQQTNGDILVFLPGVGEITRVAERLGESRTTRQILPLHGSLNIAQQTAALAPPQENSKRIILATNVAEASVTVQGVDYVIDTGLARVLNLNLISGFSSLELSRIALFNARQRSGRAARQKAGVSWRLWTEHEELTQAEAQQPECSRTDLSSTLLLLAHLGIRDFANFAWLDRPPGRIFDLAIMFLKQRGALDKDSRLTEFGKKLLQFPLPPRLGSLLLLGEELGVGRMASRVCAILNERDFLTQAATTPYECDLQLRLELLDEVERTGRASGVHIAGARGILESAAQLERLIRISKNEKGLEFEKLPKLILRSQSDRLSRRRGVTSRALMVGGRGVKLDPDSQVRTSEFFVSLTAMDIPGQSETNVRLASGYSKAQVREILKEHIQVSESIEFVEVKAKFFSSRTRTVLGLPLEEPSLTPVDAEKVKGQLAEILTSKWGWIVSQHEALKHFTSRVQFLSERNPEFKTELSTEVIKETLNMAAYGKTSIQQVLEADLVGMLKMNLDSHFVKILDKEVPHHFHAPSGHSHVIQYVSHGAFVEVRLQEIFGVNASPKLVFETESLAFHLLAPNFRPVQITTDLAGFWVGAYKEVRKELRLRYPKHSWPDDPLTAVPEAKGRRRK